ncbi:MAG: YbaB/EbfC family nucleoid-associated protein [Oscillibacter sp.]|uniref:YbaB/EbfC family nucleoid-associated protein n=1 Tax=Oscillibacter sp. TaxID=1945593 RepID=UPI0028988097|nr:YbaB/EbfC family nucleoid-associated protein [Oscillibacter sp.]MEA4993854.1 YbaB/EbfC family nucleoid-associated protein [Oscillibacter sp.]
MSYSARRGFTNGSMRPTGAARQQEMQQKIQEMQEAMNTAQSAVEVQEFSASVGGGAVEAKVNGKKEILSVNIKPEAVDPEDVEMLQDLIVSAVNEALRQAGDAMEASLNDITGGMDLGGFSL